MAILSNGKFYGFLCSVKETGQKLANGVKEYVEDFMSGFAGHGWKLWEYMTGKWKLEIDTIVVRETMIVFEMLISKIRAIIGAQTISQGHGKVKSARISDDGTEYLIVLEDEDMSIVAHDFVRCQTFVGDKTKLYHVEVDS
ncbi:collagen-like protein, partial [Bacteroides sp. AF27-33]